MSLALTLGCGLLGAGAGPVLDLAVERLPRHAPAPTAAIAVDPAMALAIGGSVAVAARPAAVRTRRPGCTDECRPALPHRRVIITALAAALCMTLAARRGAPWDLLPLLTLTLAAVPLAFCDAEHLLLPKALARAGTAAVAVAMVVAAAGSGQWHRLPTAGLCALIGLAATALISLARPSWMGWGDTRMVTLIALGAGWLGVSAVIGVLFYATVAAGVVGAIVLISRRSMGFLPFGVFLAAGGVLGIIAR